MEAYDKQAAYRAVIARIRDTVELPPNRAPQSWLALQLEVSRQLVYIWADRGIPEEYAGTIAELLGMDPIQVCPQTPIYLPTDVFQDIVQSKKRKSFSARMIELIRLGFQQSAPETVAPVKRAITKAEQPMKAIGGFIPISAEELETQREEAIKAGADLSIRGRSK